MQTQRSVPDVRRWWWVVAVLACVLAVPAYLVAAAAAEPEPGEEQVRASESAADLPEVAPDEVVGVPDGPSVAGPGVQRVVATPGADVTVAATRPAASTREHRAAEDGQVVAVRWSIEHRYALPPAGAEVDAAPPAGTPDVEIALTRDGDDVDLGDAGTTSVPGIAYGATEVTRGGVVLGVAEGGADDADLTLTVTFDGVDQTLDLLSGDLETGRAAGLYDAQPRRYTDGRCDLLAALPADVSLTSTCAVGAIELTAWTPRTGWVEAADDRWAVLRVGMVVNSYATRGDDFWGRVTADLAVTLDGEPPVAGSPGPIPNSDDDAEPSVFLLAGGAEPGELRVTGEILAEDPDGGLDPVTVTVNHAAEVRGA
ncbi:hypothetical protein RDV89_13185 [Nocardioides zeae]|uniref:Uncharacterized protein n=1 Tax=Nocardioides imazamoxiresistens TaxID=3231893 RepID=A0ABU3PZ34_9ACTN|nr:hypothetical protein [Nocardioides zeae]MDT9594030.1 hypothetical protein [Nocardioides zeae]